MIQIPQIPDIYKKIALFGIICVMAILPVFFFISSKQDSETDLIRIAHLSLINERISDALRRGVNIPLPKNALEFNFGEVQMGYQGVAGQDLFLALGIEFLKDPASGEMYNYFMRPDTKDYEIVALLDDPKYANFRVGESPAYSLGSSKGNILVVNSGKNKGQLVSSVIKTAQKVDLADPEKRKQIGWESQKSCLEIKTKNPDAKSGKYLIEMNERILSVYCDMKTDNGGWTLFYANNGHASSTIKMSYADMRDALATTPVDAISEYDDPNLAGLIDFNFFTGLGAKEIIIRNRTGDPTKWVKFSFSTPAALKWALGPRILGQSTNGCSRLLGGATWSIINQDGTIKYDNLSEIMNHNGTSWGVSHERYWCNDLIGNANPHLAFYVAGDKQDGSRARGTDGVGGAWGGENEYRYFIR